MAEPEANAATENLQEKKLKKNGRIYWLLLLAAVPGLCYSSAKLHVIKIGAAETLRCEIKALENSTWQSKEIKNIAQPLGAHKECFIYNYDYGTLTNKTFEEAKKLVDKEDVNRLRLCTKFIAIRNREIFPENYPKEFASYCEDISHEFTFDMVSVISYMTGCLIFVPFGDIYGRKRILTISCKMALLSLTLKIIFLHYTREQLGELLINFAYPAMKYTTQALVLETTTNALRPLAFVLIFVGMHIPSLIAGVMPPVSVYWKCLHLIALGPVLILPLLTWFYPESALWLASIKEDKLAQIVADTVDHPRKQNEYFFFLRNKKERHKKVEVLFQELSKVNRVEFILINVLAVLVGFLSFYSYSKHKLMYHVQDDSIRFLNRCSGLLAVLLSVPCAYLMNCVKVSMGLVFLATGVSYLFLAQLYSNMEMTKDFPTLIMLISCTEITSSALQILYEFYVQEIFPTSHRCLCTGWCGAAASLGLLLVIVTRQLNEAVSHLISSAACLVGCILTLIWVKNLKMTNPLVLDFSDTPKTSKFCCNCN